VILPTTLRPGDTVALIAPAGPVTPSMMERALERCQRLGLRPVPGSAVLERAGYLAGTDQQRAEDFQAAVDSDACAIWAVRGGYGTLRILHRLDLTPLRDRPRPFIGFSDNTAVHLALSGLGLVSIHGPHAGYRHFPPATEQAFRAVLMSDAVPGELPVPPYFSPITLCGGIAEGRLVGGNLAMLAASCGTPLQPDTRGALLFLEDVGEPLYRVDRMLAQLRLAGMLEGVAGVAVGEFTGMPDPVFAAAADGEPCVQDLLAEVLGPLGVPLVMGLPFGHGRENWSLPVGVRARLDADLGRLALLEPASAAPLNPARRPR
jgi:muramoyltetrapeptide carboxypeptidase